MANKFSMNSRKIINNIVLRPGPPTIYNMRNFNIREYRNNANIATVVMQSFDEKKNARSL